MKTIKLKMEDFLSNELVNQIVIVGGAGPIGGDPPPQGGPRVLGPIGGDVDPDKSASNNM